MSKLNYYKSRLVKHLKALVWYLTMYYKFKQILKRHGIYKIKPIQFLKWHHGSHYFIGNTKKDNRIVFIKTGGNENLITREIKVLKYIKENRFDKSDWYIPNVVAFLDEGRFAFIATKYITGETLTSVISHNRLTNQNRYELVKQFNQICDFLYSHDLIHRDVRPDNILIHAEKESMKVTLIDFAYTVSNNKLEFSEIDLSDLKKQLYFLGAGLNPEPLIWDDAYSFYKISEQLGVSIDNDLNELMKTKIGRLVYRIDKN
ncbi:protein kinase domain-containing protein [Sporomusa termitida]|uniref:Protein kinase domain protein n=1 Tax=Sporomusa termitida TaxID=2377 RepID=A0A517DXD6_9FIRM|nr:protein kinase [Sporomusa termitida]QDR82012.1 Protein kinase domain protein [Sporomusa termitida]